MDKLGETADTSDEIFELGTFSWESDSRASRDVQRIEEASRIQEYELARKRLENGKYGSCDKCSGPIESERLKVMPTATLCSSCKNF